MHRLLACFALGLLACSGKTGSTSATDADASMPAEVPPCDTGSSPLTLVGSEYVYDFAVDDSNAYVATANGVYRVPRTGGPWAHVAGAADSDAVTIAIDATDVYWQGSLLSAPDSNGKQGTIAALLSAPLGGGPSTTLFSCFSGFYASIGLAVDATRVYGASNSSVASISIDGGAPEYAVRRDDGRRARVRRLGRLCLRRDERDRNGRARAGRRHHPPHPERRRRPGFAHQGAVAACLHRRRRHGDLLGQRGDQLAERPRSREPRRLVRDDARDGRRRDSLSGYLSQTQSQEPSVHSQLHPSAEQCSGGGSHAMMLV